MCAMPPDLRERLQHELNVTRINVVSENLTVWIQSLKPIIGIALNFPILRDRGFLLMLQCVA